MSDAPINTVILGAAGRMGGALIRGLLGGTVPNLRLAGAVDRPDSSAAGKDVGQLSGASACGIALTGDLAEAGAKADVWIDFSHHSATAEHISRAAEWGVPVVIGTTGLSAEEEAAVRSAAGKIAVVMAPNMSLGVNLLFSLVEQAARALKGKGYDIEIIERHHRKKKDSPSGTALGLGKAAARGSDWDLDNVAVHGREGMIDTPERPDEQIGFHAVRGGDFVGDHTVVFATEGESVELSHRATTRDTFARGALLAAAWVAERKPGLYSMKDVLGIDP